jgi:mercuric ion transport protein
VKSGLIEKTATIGAILGAAACPACFPMLAIVGTALGFGIFRPFEGWVFVAFQVFIGLALIGNIVSFLRNRHVAPLIVGVASPLLLLFVLHVWFDQVLLYLGLFGLALASILNFFVNRKCASC